jgi:hypothetical protein
MQKNRRLILRQMDGVKLDLRNLDVKRWRTKTLDITEGHLLWGMPRLNLKG